MIELEHYHRYLLARRLATNGTVLDIACGEGFGAAMLADKAMKVIGIDVSGEAIRHARSRYSRDNLQFMVGDCFDIPIPDHSVDLVVSVETTEHHAMHEQMMRELKRVLRPSGILFISSPDKYRYSIVPGNGNQVQARELYQQEFKRLVTFHFKNVVYFGQRTLYGSAILQDLDQPSFKHFLKEDEEIIESPQSGIISPASWIVLASDSNIPDVSSSILEKPIEELDSEFTPESESNGTRQVISILNKAIAEKDKQIRDLSFKNSLLEVASFIPDSLQFPNAWVGHLPFAAWLIRQLAPRIFVELGTHSGNSYFSFCQSVKESNQLCTCYSVDTWLGDDHANHYGEEIYTSVSAHNEKHFAGFSQLMRMTFDKAVEYFLDESIDLLHIDGLHTYEAVKHDFETWLPKLAPGAVVIFHDTNVRERGFGVWRFWEQLKAIYPAHFEFRHSHGLGIIQLNNGPAGKKLRWLQPDSNLKSTIIRYFDGLGKNQLVRFDAFELKENCDRLHKKIFEINAAHARQDEQLTRLVRALWNLHTKRLRHLCRSIRGGMRGIFHRSSAQTVIFDSEWYLKKNPDVRAAKSNPLDHFMRHGWKEGRNPSPLFDVQYYLKTYEDVRAAGVNPLNHFLNHGWREKRNPHPLFNVQWYLKSYADVCANGTNPLEHFIKYGWKEGRNPHPLFDVKWYLETYPEVRTAGMNPLSHYIEYGSAQGYNPSPYFDAKFYVEKYPEATANPLVHHIEHLSSDALSRRGPANVDISSCLPQSGSLQVPEFEVSVDVIVPVYRGIEDTQRCLESLLSDGERPPGKIRVIDDCSPEPELTKWLSSLAESGAIEFQRNEANLGFVRTVNKGMVDAGRNDVLLLNSDTVVPHGFLRRMMAHAYSAPKVASVTPLSNNGGEFCNYPALTIKGGPLPSGYTLEQIDIACRTANGLRRVEIPTGVGFCMYIRRECLDEIGCFDAETFGRGYGEETDFCKRALKAGWHHFLACDTFVYHVGEVSFGANAPERAKSWDTLVGRYPDLPLLRSKHLISGPRVPVIFSTTISLFNSSLLPTILILNYNLTGKKSKHVEKFMDQFMGSANILLLSCDDSAFELSIPSLPGHPTLSFQKTEVGRLRIFLRAFTISQFYMQHWLGIDKDVHNFLEQLGLPVELTVYDTFRI